MFRRLLLFALLVAALPFGARASDFSQTYIFNGPHTDGPLKTSFANSGINTWFISWHSAASPLSACSIEVDSSADGHTWGSGDVIPAQPCVTSGAAQGSFTNAYVRINVTALSGGGVTVLLNGYGGGSTFQASVPGSSCQNYDQGPIPLYSYGLLGSLGRALAGCLTSGQSANVSNVSLFTPSTGLNQSMVVDCQVTLAFAATSFSTLPQCVVSYTDTNDNPQTVTVTPAWASGTAGCTGSTTNTAGNSCKGTSNLIVPMLGTPVTFSTSGYASTGAAPMQYNLVAYAHTN